jgi:uncharacterized membrane protein (UPF0127 family)
MTYVNPTPARARPAAGTLPLRTSLLWVLLACGTALAQGTPQPRLATVDLRAGMHVIKAELAVTPAQQMTGMMFRTEMDGNEGMLFVNDEKSARCFWMKNTLVPLTIAFVADDGTIVNLADMQPQDERSHCSKAPVRFALEMRQGWFDKRGIKAGFKLSGPPFAAAAAPGSASR